MIPENEKLITLTTVNNIVHANLIKGHLEAAGIEVTIHDDSSRGIFPLVSFRIKILATDEAKAKPILKLVLIELAEAEKNPVEISESEWNVPVEVTQQNPINFARILMVTGVVLLIAVFYWVYPNLIGGHHYSLQLQIETDNLSDAGKQQIIGTLKDRLKSANIWETNIDIAPADSNCIRVDLSHIHNFNQLEPLLLSSGRLTMWSAFSNAECFQALSNINNALGAKVNDDLKAIDLGDPSLSEEEAMVLFNKTNPLFALLRPMFSQNESFEGSFLTLSEGTEIGYSFKEDREQVMEMLETGSNTVMLPKDLVFAWGTPIERAGEPGIYHLYALNKIKSNIGRIHNDHIEKAGLYFVDDIPTVYVQFNLTGTQRLQMLRESNKGQNIVTCLGNEVLNYPGSLLDTDLGISEFEAGSEEYGLALVELLNSPPLPCELSLRGEVLKF